MKFTFFICLMVTFVDIHAVSAQTIKVEGVVIDEETRVPIQGANAYITGTTTGSSTNSDGEFLFETNLKSEEELTVSFLGYDTQTFPINFNVGRSEFRFKIELHKNEIELNDIVIITDNSLWLKSYEDFKREFIGTNRFAQKTKILNRWVVNFTKGSGGELYAVASEPIVVENRALGYRIEIDMKDFSWRLNSGTGHFYFETDFQDLEPKSEFEYESWQKNRQDAYNGSRKHFFKSLFNDELSRNQFEVVEQGSNKRAMIHPHNRNPNVIRLLSRHRIPIHKYNEDVKAFSFNGPVDILFGQGPFKASNARQFDSRLRAGLRPQINNLIFLVNKDGMLFDPQHISVEGYFVGERIANMLPESYQP